MTAGRGRALALLAPLVAAPLVGAPGGTPAAHAAGPPCGARAAVCTCITPASATEALHAFDVVFIGTVRQRRVLAPADTLEARSFPAGEDTTLARSETVLDVDFLWKSDTIAVPRSPRALTLRVWTGDGVRDCGIAFQKGEIYLVYARRARDGALLTSGCTRTRSLAEPQARADVRELYDATQPPVAARTRRAG